jgi:hypothetical protein
VDSDFWAPILWYRDFYDVPRLLCVDVEGGVLVLDCPFSESLDEYRPTYSVTFVPDDVASMPNCEEIVERAVTLSPAGELPVSVDRFDRTRRAAVNLPGRLGNLKLRKR